ncbi:hypothetical protein PF004_g15815 [Phytophthora fragariae]|uniref:Uncharacterized protein n=1 Tax=Phytophthora fragariae TaxID=53985 RepID=A0A6G0NK69_9STRA|nr:hypothetical protein PF004_g15815 [Phytophthora fragariae]
MTKTPVTPPGVLTRSQGPAITPPGTPPRAARTDTSTLDTATTTTQSAAGSTTDAATMNPPSAGLNQPAPATTTSAESAYTTAQQPTRLLQPGVDTQSAGGRDPATRLLPSSDGPATTTNSEMTTLVNAIHLMMSTVARLEARGWLRRRHGVNDASGCGGNDAAWYGGDDAIWRNGNGMDGGGSNGGSTVCHGERGDVDGDGDDSGPCEPGGICAHWIGSGGDWCCRHSIPATSSARATAALHGTSGAQRSEDDDNDSNAGSATAIIPRRKWRQQQLRQLRQLRQ